MSVARIEPIVRHRSAEVTGSDDVAFAEVLAAVVEAMADRPYGMLGGVASAAYGRPRWTKDIDIFVPIDGADETLEALAANGFDIERTNPSWLYKAFRQGVLVDVIFKVKADVYFDERMHERVRWTEVEGVAAPLLAPEDIVVTKAIAGDEEAPWHWYDALGVLAVNDLDWAYVLERARKSPNRVLSLLHYALSIDLPVPLRAVRELHEYLASSWR